MSWSRTGPCYGSFVGVDGPLCLGIRPMGLKSQDFVLGERLGEIIGHIPNEPAIEQVRGLGGIHIRSFCLMPVSDTLIRGLGCAPIRVKFDRMVRTIIDEKQMRIRLSAVHAPGDGHINGAYGVHGCSDLPCGAVRLVEAYFLNRAWTGG